MQSTLLISYLSTLSPPITLMSASSSDMSYHIRNLINSMKLTPQDLMGPSGPGPLFVPHPLHYTISNWSDDNLLLLIAMLLKK